jgi:putative ABC transport system permease protein
MKPNVEYIDLSDPMPEIYVNRVRSVPGVAWAVPYYQASATLRTTGGLLKAVTVIGVDDASFVAAPVGAMVVGDVTALTRPNAVILDTVGFAQLFPGQPYRTGDVVEIGQSRAEVVGICRVPPSWSGLGTVYTRRSHAVVMARETVNPVTFVLVRSVDGKIPEEVARAITRETGLAAHSRAEFSRKTLLWFLRNSGLAENFGITITLGFVIGVAIVGQTFYMFSVENLKQFAALKAIGVSHRKILAMLMAQAVFVAALGFCIGIGLSSAFFAAFSTSDTGGLRGMFMAPEIAIGTAVFVLGITLLACLMSVRRVLVVDPAIVFRG